MKLTNSVDMFPQTTKLQKQGKIPIDMFSHTVKWAKIAVDMFPHTNEWDLTFLLSTQAILKQSAFCRENPNKSKDFAIFGIK